MSRNNKRHKNNNEKETISFPEQKRIWKTKKFISSLFSNWEEKDIDDNDEFVIDFRAKIDRLENRNYRIAAYGSLLNSSDVSRTLSKVVASTAAYVCGYERIFNMGAARTGSYLNVRETSSERRMLVHLITVPVENMPSFFVREMNYDIIEIEAYIDETLPLEAEENIHETAFMVVGKPGNESTIALQPQLNYLHLAINGASKIAGLQGVNNFLDTTFTYNKTMREWFKDVNLLDYMWTHSYLKR